MTLKKSPDAEFTCLTELSKTLQERGINVFTEATFEAALCERLAKGFKEPPQTPAVYLTNCYRRTCAEIAKENAKKDKKEERISKLSEFKRLVVSYLSILVRDDRVFPIPSQYVVLYLI